MDIFIKNGIIKKKEECEQTIYKKDYNTCFSEDVHGPYYDITETHIHNWKKNSLIKNFKGGQNHLSAKFKKSPIIQGIYCSICHCKLKKDNINISYFSYVPEITPFKRKQEDVLLEKFKKIKIDKASYILLWDRLYYLIYKNYIDKYKNIYNLLIKNNNQIKLIYKKWESLIYKLTAPNIIYELNPFETIITKEYKMTIFQGMRYRFPNYKKDSYFIVKNNEKFRRNYVKIE